MFEFIKIKRNKVLPNSMLNSLNHDDVKIVASEVGSVNSQLITGESDECNDIDKLKDIVQDPYATESQWLGAAHKLNNLQNSTPKLPVNFKLSLIAVTFLSCLLSMCIVSYNSSFKPQPVKRVISTKPNIDFGPYMKTLSKAIHEHWHSDGKPHIIVTSFKVLKTGEITDIKLERLSKNSKEDASAIQAIIDSMPANPPLPPGSPDHVDITFTFESKVSKHAHK